MRAYLVSRKDGVVECVPAGGLLETARYYLLLRPYRQDEVPDHAIVAVYAKGELVGRPLPVSDRSGPSHPAMAVSRGAEAERADVDQDLMVVSRGRFDSTRRQSGRWIRM